MKKFPYSILIIQELYAFGIRLMDIVSTPLKDIVYVASVCALMKKANGNLEKALGKALKSEFTSLLVEKDGIRDSVFVGLKEHISAFTHSQVAAKATAALYLSGIIDSVGSNIHRDAYSNETTGLNTLFSYLDESSAKQALQTIGAAEWLDQLTAAQQDFEKTYQEKISTESAINYPLAAESKDIITQYVDAIINYVSNNSIIEPALYGPLKEKIDEVSTDILTQARARITKAENAKKKQVDTPTAVK